MDLIEERRIRKHKKKKKRDKHNGGKEICNSKNIMLEFVELVDFGY